MNRFTRLIALPILSAGLIGGAAVGLAGTAGATVGQPGTASAGMTINDDGSMVATPNTVAQPWVGWPRRGYYYYWPQQGFTSHFDNTVQQSH